jgi:hypothetical protein
MTDYFKRPDFSIDKEFVNCWKHRQDLFNLVSEELAEEEKEWKVYSMEDT